MSYETFFKQVRKGFPKKIADGIISAFTDYQTAGLTIEEAKERGAGIMEGATIMANGKKGSRS